MKYKYFNYKSRECDITEKKHRKLPAKYINNTQPDPLWFTEKLSRRRSRFIICMLLKMLSFIDMLDIMDIYALCRVCKKFNKIINPCKYLRCIKRRLIMVQNLHDLLMPEFMNKHIPIDSNIVLRFSLDSLAKIKRVLNNINDVNNINIVIFEEIVRSTEEYNTIHTWEFIELMISTYRDNDKWGSQGDLIKNYFKQLISILKSVDVSEYLSGCLYSCGTEYQSPRELIKVNGMITLRRDCGICAYDIHTFWIDPFESGIFERHTSDELARDYDLDEDDFYDNIRHPTLEEIADSPWKVLIGTGMYA